MASVSGVEDSFGKRLVLSSEVAEVSYSPFSHQNCPKLTFGLQELFPCELVVLQL